MENTEQSTPKAVLINFGILAATWMICVALVQVAARISLSGLMAQFALPAGFAIGLAAAWRYQAKVAAVVIGASLVSTLSETVMRVIWGSTSVQGRATHFAVLGAATMGLLLGFVLSRTRPAPRKSADAANPLSASLAS